MKAAILAVAEDLRARRLLPVAAILILALVAAPIVLLKSPAEAPSPLPAPDANRPAAASLELERADGASEGSRLAEFETRDPFAARRPRGDAPSPSARRPPSPAGVSASASEPSAGAAAQSRVPLRPLPQASSAPRGVKPPAASPPAAKPASPARKRGKDDGDSIETADVKVGRRGEERLRRDVKRLAVLPSERSPLLVFLGSSLSGRSAVFLVDAGLTVTGDGSCDPSPRNCSFLTLRPDRRHDQAFFEDPAGRRWSLKLLDLGEMPIEKALEQQAAAEAKGARAGSARGAKTAAFAVPPLASTP